MLYIRCELKVSHCRKGTFPIRIDMRATESGKLYVGLVHEPKCQIWCEFNFPYWHNSTFSIRLIEELLDGVNRY